MTQQTPIGSGLGASTTASQVVRGCDLSGVYCQDCDIAPLVSEEIAANQFGSIPLGVMPHAVDSQAVDCLWRLSEHLTSTFYEAAV